MLGEDAHDAMLVRGVAGSELAVRGQSELEQLGPVDVALSLLHGPFGEDGTIQGLFEMMGTRYGRRRAGQRGGMDKHYMKLVLASGLPPIGPFVPSLPVSGSGTRWRPWTRARRCISRCSSSRPEPVRVLGFPKSNAPASWKPPSKGPSIRSQGGRRAGLRWRS